MSQQQRAQALALMFRQDGENMHEIVCLWVRVFLAPRVELAEEVALERYVCAGEVGRRIGFCCGVDGGALGLLRRGEGVWEEPFSEAG